MPASGPVSINLVAIAQPIAVGVRQVRVGLARTRRRAVAYRVDRLSVRVQVLDAIVQTVAVGVRIRRIRRSTRIRVADKARRRAAVRNTCCVTGAGIQSIGRHAGLDAVVDAVAIGVIVQRIGRRIRREQSASIDFVTVGQTVVVAVGIEWVRLARIEYAVAAGFLAVCQAVVVGVGVVRIGAQCALEGISYAIVVRID